MLPTSATRSVRARHGRCVFVFPLAQMRGRVASKRTDLKKAYPQQKLGAAQVISS
jgi:hypothetical protein